MTKSKRKRQTKRKRKRQTKSQKLRKPPQSQRYLFRKKHSR